MKVNLIQHTDNPETMIAQIARISHQSFSEEEPGIEENQELIRKLRSWGHWTPFEFSDATFYVEGVSRACLAQITRHRLVSFMVQSMRYTEQNRKDTVIPQSIEDAGLVDEYKENIKYSFFLYQEAINTGVVKEDARFLLPLATSTSLYLKANFREFYHIIELRNTKAAQWEIRNLSRQFLSHLYKIAPVIFEELYAKN